MERRNSMFYVLVKFSTMPEPVMIGTTHVSHASRLVTMSDVEWVSPTISGGGAIGHETATGGRLTQGIGGPYISSYRPAAKLTDAEAAQLTPGNQAMLAAQADGIWDRIDPGK